MRIDFKEQKEYMDLKPDEKRIVMNHVKAQ